MSQPSEFFDERNQNILRRQKLHLSKTTSENTIGLSLLMTKSFIFVKMLKQHLMQFSNARLL